MSRLFRRWVRALKVARYRQRVVENLRVMIPVSAAGFRDHEDDLQIVAEAAVAENWTIEHGVLAAVTIVLRDSADRRLSAEDRILCARQIKEGPSDFIEMIKDPFLRRLAEGRIPASTHPFVVVFSSVDDVLNQWLIGGKITVLEKSAFVTEIANALVGVSLEQRTAARDALRAKAAFGRRASIRAQTER